jgi:hypothetical protein
MSVGASRITFAAYALFLGGIIYLANHGGGHWWSFITDLPCGDKLGHLGLVATLTLLLNLALRGRRAPGRLSGILLGSLLVAIFMSLEECSQAVFPSRSLDLFDGLANLAGVVVGDLAARKALSRRPARAVTS